MKTSYSLDAGRIQRSQRNIEFSMTPMIDVIFLLLVFFIATSSFRVVEKLLPSNLSQTNSTSGQEDSLPPEEIQDLLEQVVVRMKKSGDGVVVELNGSALSSFDELRGRLRSIAQLQPGLPVIVDPEPSIPAGQVVKAYDWARSAGLSRVYLATSAQEE